MPPARALPIHWRAVRAQCGRPSGALRSRQRCGRVGRGRRSRDREISAGAGRCGAFQSWHARTTTWCSIDWRSPRTYWRCCNHAHPHHVRLALVRAIRNVRCAHEAWRPRAIRVEVEPGIVLERRPEALARVGVYAPGGRAVYPSSVIMGVVPAHVAGVDQVILCSPARSIRRSTRSRIGRRAFGWRRPRVRRRRCGGDRRPQRMARRRCRASIESSAPGERGRPPLQERRNGVPASVVPGTDHRQDQGVAHNRDT